MAKATGLSSQFRGKVGNIIGYLTKNRAGRYEQTVKAYQPVVANPQSYAQALARVPIGPVQRVCSALLLLIQRGFEGTAYGEPSKAEFLSYNLKYFRGPFMTKGAVAVPPGPMLIAKGSLRQVGITEIEGGVDSSVVRFDLNYDISRSHPNKGAIADNLLTNNAWLVPGEQLTFVLVLLVGGEYQYRYESLYLNTSDTSYPRGILHYAVSHEDLFCFFADDFPEETTIVAAACIRSQAYGESSFKRSTAFLICNTDAQLYNDDAAVKAAVASYRTGEDPEDWEDDPTPEYQQLAYLCMVTITEDMVTGAGSTTLIGQKCLGYATKGGEFGIFYRYSTTYSMNCLINGNADIMLWHVQGQTGGCQINGTYQPAREWNEIYGTMNQE